MKSYLCWCLVAVFSCHGLIAQDRIGVNFAHSVNPGAGALTTLPSPPPLEAAGTLGLGAPAGVQFPRQVYWNNVSGDGPAGASGVLIGLINDAGSATAATITWGGSDIGTVTNWQNGGDGKMLNGALVDLFSSPVGGGVFIEVADLPASFTADGYDVIVYADFDGTILDQFILYDDGATVESLRLTDVVEPSAANGGQFEVNTVIPSEDHLLADASSLPVPNVGGTYVVFEGKTASSFSLLAFPESGSLTAISALQIVKKAPVVPEPGAAVLLMGSAALLAAWRLRPGLRRL